MAEENKPVEVPKDTTAPAAEPAVEAKPVETTEVAPAVEAAPVVEAPATTTEAPATETTEETAAPAAAAEEAKKEEVVPVEEGQLEHKGLNFPKNFIYSKQFFWFGSDAVEAKSLSHYRRSEKSAEAGHHNTAWASHTGKGLFFFGEKSAPVGVINLADATEPATDGPTKFFFTAKGQKHAFKAANAADRDNWVSQLKLKIAEAKELATSVTESEAYKTTLESFKPAAPVKKEEATEAPKEEAAAPAEPAVVVDAAEAPAAATEETPKEAAKEEPKRRSASRKRASIFGSFFGQKEESKKEEKAAEAAPAAEAPKEEAAPAVAEPATETAAAPAEVAAAPVETPAEAEDKPAEKKEEKPVPSKRNSIFGVFGKKEKKAAEAAAAEPAKEETTPVTSETAPALPPVETSTPLGDAVADATPATTEAPKEEAAPATNGDSKKDVKAEKRKSSLPFAFGKKDKSPSASDEEGEKPEKSGPFSKLRATIKARGRSEKPVEKAEEKPAEAAPVAEAAEPAAKPAEEEPVNKPESAVPAAPVVTAAA